MAEHRLISGDSHFVEPPELWTDRIDSTFQARAAIMPLEGRVGQYFVCET
jgi:hypothetical protein